MLEHHAQPVVSLTQVLASVRLSGNTTIAKQCEFGFYQVASSYPLNRATTCIFSMSHTSERSGALWDGAPFGKASVMIGAALAKTRFQHHLLYRVRSHSRAGLNSPRQWRESFTLLQKTMKSWSEQYGRRPRPSGALRIADEYQAWKGRGKLDALLREAIPDEKFQPGPLHNLLFKLPWADILTTNFDTLLERAAADEIDRRYTVVRSQRDIPGSLKPRIVKLHGSFPDSRPFIITEDDFRTYEQTNPVMVNLVQQVFVENTCCLLGFSGDDPNFLKWRGGYETSLAPPTWSQFT